MKELILKDIEVCRGALLVGFLGLIGPYLCYGAYLLFAQGLSYEESIEVWSLAMLGASSTSITLSIASLAILGGYIVAVERRQRSAEFLAYLPPSRHKVIFSKFIVCVSWLLFAAITYLAIVDWFVPWLSSGKQVLTGYQGRGVMLSVAICILGSSFFGSCILESPTLAAALGFVATVAGFMCIGLISMYTGWFTELEQGRPAIAAMCATIGVLGFAGGWLLFVKRVEP